MTRRADRPAGIGRVRSGCTPDSWGLRAGICTRRHRSQKSIGGQRGFSIIPMSETIPHRDLLFQEAWKTDKSVETLWHPEQNTYLCSIAPHGGDIEACTDDAAIELFKNMPKNSCSMWAFHGFGENAFENYHITSSKITPEAFPELGEIEDVGFNYCVSFHVKRGADVIEVGGAADEALRKRIADTLENAVNNNWDAEYEYGEIRFKSNSEENITNWLTEDSCNGVQIELPIYASRNFRKRIASALADLYQNL